MSKPEKITKKNGEIVWKQQVYLGVDSITGKKRRTTVTVKDRKNLKYAIAAAHSDFASNGYTTVKDKNSIEKRYTFEEVYEMWHSDYQYTVKESAYWKTVGIFRNHILPSYGHKIINDITALDCQSAVHRWFETVKDTKKYNIYAIMVFDYAIKKLKLIKENPAKDLSYPKKDNIDETVENYYTREELNYFGECMKKEVKRTNTYKWYTLFRLLAYTGMRKGEAFALTWDDVDLEAKEIKINKTLTRGVGNKIIVQSPKTMRSKRIVTIDEETVVALKRLKAELKSTNIILGTKRSNLVFPNTKNTWTDPNQSNTKLDMIIKRYNLKKITPHGFRHTHITLLFLAGESIKVVQDRVGHGDITTTMDIYNHVMKENRDLVPTNFTDFMKNEG